MRAGGYTNGVEELQTPQNVILTILKEYTLGYLVMQSHIISQQFNRIFCVLCILWQLTRRILEFSQPYAQPNVSAQYNATNNMFFLRTATLCRRRLKTLEDIYSHKKRRIFTIIPSFPHRHHTITTIRNRITKTVCLHHLFKWHVFIPFFASIHSSL